jgi:hypothetical protein
VSPEDLGMWLVPVDWTAEEALRMVGALYRIVDAIWLLHGPAMAALLSGARKEEEPDDDEEDLPF